MDHEKSFRVNERSLSAIQSGYYTSILAAVLTPVTFIIAFLTPPLSGPFCRSGCYEYPYLNILSKFPRDYLWMYPAIFVSMLFLVLIICIRESAASEKKLFGSVAAAFAIMASLTLAVDYFIQITVIQPSLLNREADGISILTQYNPHGIFIALEEAGYLMMSISFLSAAFTFSKQKRLENKLRWIFILNFAASILGLIIISLFYGINREYIFEVTVISINWITLTAAGILLSIHFKRSGT